MALKQRTEPVVLKKLDALLPRLSLEFYRLQDLKGESARSYKGYIGEKKVDGYIETYFSKCTILHDVCLRINGSTFQIDTIIITLHALYIIEIKNFNGKITFNTNLKQFTREDGQIETGFRHPITQAENHKLYLTNWLYERNIYDVPIHFFIAISDPGTIIKVMGDEGAVSRVVAHGEHIPEKITKIEEQYRRKSRHSINRQMIGGKILKECKDFDFDILGRYGVKWSDIIPGVRCPGCGVSGMKRQQRNWHCLKCGRKSKNAHLKAISDYFLLIKPSISNKECRWFLGLESRSIATRILQSSGLVYMKERKRWIQKS